MNKKIFLILLIIFLIVPAGADAARELNGDQLDLQQTEAGQVIIAKDNVELIYDELRITAEDEAIYRRYNGEIEFRNNVEFFYRQYEGQSVELTGNLEQEIIHLIGEAQITGPTSYIEADKIDFYQAENRIEVQGNVYLEYQDFWAEADQLTYYTERKFMHLEGNVKGERNGESFTADAADINQKTEEVKLQGQARVTLPRAEESESSTDENSEAAENDN
ncbi:LptA/OstA family protein [Halanaerobium congolense]|jgi:lipopolysaccharide export system protein LptA|uniref:OstA-like protein n=1 Tax=Halanaerobium congolense TaxID=54121 RepID=A0A4R7EJ56_9FIRM|nr:LptA/OstA family protein [Halanaerobium congolense]TDP24199.1 OstA-like protein [Halanaerobium congolense]TDS33994.1 OstA-like protein [Halanaerobium congolense]SDH27081.1 OstA-like protein [Halanaerobium congolense]